MGSNSELSWLLPRRGDAGVAGSTSRSRNAGSGQKSRNYDYELTVRDTSVRCIVNMVLPEPEVRPACMGTGARNFTNQTKEIIYL